MYHQFELVKSFKALCMSLDAYRITISCFTFSGDESVTFLYHFLPFFKAFMTMAIILLHMFWGVVFFDACEKQRWWAVAAVVISHLIVSCLVSSWRDIKNLPQGNTRHLGLGIYD